MFWSVLDKPGNSDTAERIALMKRFLATFGVGRIAALLVDREFYHTTEANLHHWHWLKKQGIKTAKAHAPA